MVVFVLQALTQKLVNRTKTLPTPLPAHVIASTRKNINNLHFDLSNEMVGILLQEHAVVGGYGLDLFIGTVVVGFYFKTWRKRCFIKCLQEIRCCGIQ